MQGDSGRLRAILVLLLVASAALFAVGAAVERHHHVEKAPSPQETTAPAEGSSESGTGSSSGSEGKHGGETHPGVGETSGTGSEKLFGVDPEAPRVVAAGVAASVVLALAVWMLRRRAVLVVAILFGIALAALDLREMVHQVHESRPSLIAVSIVLAVLHLLVAAAAAMLLRAPRGAEVAT
jgi:hypothetical protein